MNYDKFVENAKQQDDRNQFESLSRVDQFNIPSELWKFYKNANPIDVEIQLEDSTSVKFYSVETLNNIQKEYGMDKDNFIFASREGDPIFLKGEKIYTAVHGEGKWTPKLLSNSFKDFLENLF